MLLYHQKIALKFSMEVRLKIIQFFKFIYKTIFFTSLHELLVNTLFINFYCLESIYL